MKKKNEQWDKYCTVILCEIFEFDYQIKNCFKLGQPNYLSYFFFHCKVVEPTLHRDFMYSSLNAFPRSSFSPVSTPLCREVHKKLGKPRYRVCCCCFFSFAFHLFYSLHIDLRFNHLHANKKNLNRCTYSDF